YEEHQIDFSANPNQNVTYILGKNGSGKTILFEAINWALFIDSNYNYISKINREARAIAKDNNIKEESYVEIFFSIIDDILNNQKEFHIKRFFQYDEEVGDLNFFGSFIENFSNEPEIINENNFKKIINEFFPEKLREFYFFSDNMVISFKTKLKEIIQIIENKTSETFLKLILNPDVRKGTKINFNCDLHILKNGLKFNFSELARGEQYILAISLISAIFLDYPIKYPIILDNPFRVMRKELIKNIYLYISRIWKENQIILLINDYLHEYLYPYLQNSIGKYYEIQYNNWSIIMER
ncbi:MAG: AAA family ATPase, partial [Promethearchaeia archaeon]